jgi:hypothetical protein
MHPFAELERHDHGLAGVAVVVVDHRLGLVGDRLSAA